MTAYLGGGVDISQGQDKADNTSGHVCTNTSCRRTFIRPLKTIIIGVSTKPFEACPYCLTQVEGVAEVPSSNPIEDGPKPPKEPIEKQTKATSGPANCSRHIGYLSERGSKEPIPDDCLTCMEIVQCMLKQAKDKDAAS